MAQSFVDVRGTREWQDVTTLPGYAALAGSRVTIQSKSGTFNHVYFGGANPPAPGDGIRVPSGVAVSGTADHVWVCGDARFAILLED